MVIEQNQGTNNLPLSQLQFPVVGIGASAGGLEAFQLFIKTIPEKSGMAYVLVQHLNAYQDSALVEILQRSTTTPVLLINDNVHLEPDNIYIIPPGKILIAMDDILKLKHKGDKKVKTIDLFFSSLGVVHQSFAVGVVLSGALNDGTLGLQVIKSYGGITFAQDQASSAFDSMPMNAVKSGAVDFILPADQIVPKLIEIIHPFQTHSNQTSSEVKETLEDDQIYKEILIVIRTNKGVDFSNYKQSTLKRRIVRRMALKKPDQPQDYLQLLSESKTEQDALYNDMLISVTNFFRDPQIFDLLCRTLLPGILNKKTANEPLRIWVAGCATGEEAYSIAMCIQEILGNQVFFRTIQIFATDISGIAIAKARTGTYQKSDLDGLSDARIKKFFIKLDGSYQVSKSIRDMCVFAQHNLLTDPPFSKMDLITCRNVMIYFEPILQKRALAAFQYALKEKGILILGKSETIGTSTDLFTPLVRTEKIYQSKVTQGRFRMISSPGNSTFFKDTYPDDGYKNTDKGNYTIADVLLLSRYTPAAVMVNDSFEILEFRGKTDQWLTLSTGKASLNVLKMARGTLAFELRNLLRLAITSKKSVSKENISFKKESRQLVNIEVIPFVQPMENHYLIVFQPVPATLPHPSDSSLHSNVADNGSVAYKQLEKELLQARDDMRAIIEVQDATNAGLQNANEELLSGYEELQSLNEELETSKEELQSCNEEINIVNKELLERNEQLTNSRQTLKGTENDKFN